VAVVNLLLGLPARIVRVADRVLSPGGVAVDHKPPSPVCKAFLLCREIHIDPQRGDSILVGRIDSHAARSFPTATRIGFFTRLTSARGGYEVEVQLHAEAGQWCGVRGRRSRGNSTIRYRSVALR
jgi:hypothetical protein